jgi:hypothetical protein
MHRPNALIPVAMAELPAILGPDLERAADLAQQEKTPGTRRAYGSDFRIFESVVPLARDQRIAGHG